MFVSLQNNVQEKFRNLSFSTSSVESNMSTDSDFEMRIAAPEDKTDIIELARNFFNKDEPLNENIGLTGPDGKAPDLEKYILSTLDEGCSLVAISNGKLVGFSMNGILKKDEPEEKAAVENEKFQTILNFLDYTSKECDIFGQFPHADKAMAVKILSVDPIMRGKGVGTKFVDRTREIAKEKGCQLMVVECTSYFSASIMRRLGFKEIYAKNYCDYIVDGKVVFTPKSPHTTFTTYVEEL